MFAGVPGQPLPIAMPMPHRGNGLFNKSVNGRLSNKIIAVFPKTLQRMSRFRFQLFFAAPMSAEIFEMWRAVRKRSADLNHWEPIALCELSLVFDGRLHLFWGVVAREVDRAWRRMLHPVG